MRKEKLLDSTYTTLPEELQSVWRHLMFQKVKHAWLQEQLHETYTKSLRSYIEGFLTLIEEEEDYEMCSGIRDLIDEYSAVLDRERI